MKVNVRKSLLAGYLILYAGMLFFLTKDYSKKEYSFWEILWLIGVFSLPAVSILFYTLSYEPKHFRWFWKITPFSPIAYYGTLWYLYGPKPINTQIPLSATIEGGITAVGWLFVTFYLAFKFAYPKITTNRKARLLLVIFSLVAATLCMTSRYISSPREKVNIKVNYVAEYNRITKPANYDPNENAAPYYEKAFAILADMPDDIKNIRQKWPGDMNDVELNKVKNWVTSNSQVLEILKLASSKPYYWVEQRADPDFPMAFKFSDLHKFTYARGYLAIQAKLLADQGQLSPALQYIIEMYKIGAHFKGNKTLVEQLVGRATNGFAARTTRQILDKTKPDSEVLKDFQQNLQTLPSTTPSDIDYSAEKLYSYDCIQRIFTDDGKGGGHVYGTRLLEGTSHVEQVLGTNLTSEQQKDLKQLKRQQTVELTEKVYSYLNEIRQKMPYQLHKENSDPEEILEEMTKNNPICSELLPAHMKILNIFCREKTDRESLIAIVALLRCRAEKSEYPATLEELLAAGYIQELPIDPFSGNPLVYKRTADNFILYSVGENFVDDGGTHGEWGTDKGDYVFWPVQTINKKQN